MTSLITAARMAALCMNAREEIITAAAPVLEANRERFGVTTPERVSCFMGQAAIESAGFRRLEEALDYSAERIPEVWPRLKGRALELAHNPRALANAAYAFKNGNGNEASGDGWRFRGRSFLQLTGAANYRAAQAGCGLSLFISPDLASRPDSAAIASLWWWQAHGCNELADASDVDGITRKINGSAMEQANVRRQLTEKARAIFV